MKKNIVVCCESMLRAMAKQDVASVFRPNTADYKAFLEIGLAREGFMSVFLEFCPWCSTKLPFPYEEAE